MISEFIGDLDFRDLNRTAPTDEIRLMLLAPLVYNSALLDRQITVPAKYVTDLASVPRLLWNIVPPIGKYDCAAVIHDWLYQKGTVTRDQADAVLLEGMRVYGIKKSLRAVIYAGVRVGGWVPWNKYRKAAVVEVAGKRAEGI